LRLPTSRSPDSPTSGRFAYPPECFIKLGLGTWLAGPYFTEPMRDFYNLEMVDTNTADYTVWRLKAPTEFAT
jgi:hypothetical protein